MALTNNELEARIIVIESKLNEIQAALNNVATRAMLVQMVNVRQAEIDELGRRLTDLESAVALLQTTP